MSKVPLHRKYDKVVDTMGSKYVSELLNKAELYGGSMTIQDDLDQLWTLKKIPAPLPEECKHDYEKSNCGDYCLCGKPMMDKIHSTQPEECKCNFIETGRTNIKCPIHGDIEYRHYLTKPKETHQIEELDLIPTGNEWQILTKSGKLFSEDCPTRDQVLMIKLNEVIAWINQQASGDK